MACSRFSGAAMAALLVAALLFSTTGDALAQRAEGPVPSLEGIDIVPNPGAQVPLDGTFVDERGKKVRLTNYIGGEKPVILTLGYYRCPQLCDLVLNGVVDALKAVDWEPGREFEMVTISIDPLETPMMAKLKKQSYVKSYGRASANRGWHFLTGRDADVRAVADAVGFGYRYNEDRKEYAHAAGIFLLTPTGKLSRCLRGIQFDPKTLRLSLLEASEGKQGSTIDSLLLWCFHYDETAGRYGLAATTVMRIGGVLTLIVLAAILLPVWLRARKRKVATN
ncbi:MAG: SCO family protein [Planctomycetota bacterium]